ncbi:MAG: globin [Sphingomonadales bacterium]|nr:globin [Sphingomonadales bacterium]MBD3774409.1 globin [Paracoccaceae bacterium]
MNAETAPPKTPYELLGGQQVIQQVVDRFYDLMDSDPQYAPLRRIHAADLAPMRHSLAGWLSAWAGGPRDWFDENPGKCMMSAHRGLGVSREFAAQWADAMARAIADVAPPDKALAREMALRLDTMAKAMVVD